ncbi:MAG: GNAT family N-acetyltransferase [Acidobacteria bacterium]|nr:GNAT family N-acetyltransferase [Acidobacteriota bacterium]
MTGASLTRSEFRGPPAEWDRLCGQFADFTLTQSYAWGEGRRADGWRVRRDQWWDDRGRLVALATVLQKRIYGFGLTYISRGPLVLQQRFSPAEAEGHWQACMSCYRKALRWGRILLCYVYQSSAQISPVTIRNSGLHPLFPPTGEYAFSSVVTLDFRDALLQGASSDWRKLFRKSEASLAAVKESTDVRDFLRARQLVARLEKSKGFTTTLTEPLLRSMVANSRLFYLENGSGEITAALLVAIAGNRAARLMAGVDPDQVRSQPGIGRVLEVAASRWVFEQAVAWYDLEGLNPYNRGVFNFKVGMRGALFSPAGMHACSRPALLAKLCGLWKQRCWMLPLYIWRTSKVYFWQLARQRLGGRFLVLSRLRIYSLDLEHNPAVEARPGFSVSCLDRFDPEDFEYRLSTVRELWGPCQDLRPEFKECYVLLGSHGYAVGYGFLHWGRAELPEISTVLPLEGKDVYISNCYLIPEFRGQRLYPYLLQQICAHARRRGARVARIAVNPANRVSVRGIEGAGFVLEKEASCLRLAGRQRLRWQEPPLAPTVHA